MIKKCRVCGEKLTKLNKYRSKIGQSRGRICKECHKNKMLLKYKSAKNPRTILLKQKYHSGFIKFNSIEEKRFFLLMRKCQALKAPIRNGHSSRVGQSVDHLVIEYDENHQRTSRHEKTICEECGNSVRYDDRGFKVCEVCGLDNGTITFDCEFHPPPDNYNLHQRKYYGK